MSTRDNVVASDDATTTRDQAGGDAHGLIERLVGFTKQCLGEGPALPTGSLNQLADTVPVFGEALVDVIGRNVDELDQRWGLLARGYHAAVAISAARASELAAHGDLDTALVELAAAHDAAAALGDPLSGRPNCDQVLAAMRVRLQQRPALGLGEQHAQIRNYFNGVLSHLGGAAIPTADPTDNIGRQVVLVAAGPGQYRVSVDLNAPVVTYDVDFSPAGGSDLITAAGVQELAHQAISEQLPAATWHTVAALTSTRDLGAGQVLLQVWSSGGTGWCAAALAEHGYAVAHAGREHGNDLLVSRPPSDGQHAEGAPWVSVGAFTRRSDAADAIRHHHDPEGADRAEARSAAGQGFPAAGQQRRPGGAGPAAARRSPSVLLEREA